MKLITLVTLLAATTVAFADSSLLKNSDFSNGITEWSGDAHTPDSCSFDPSVTDVPTTGVVVKLHRNEWTKMVQDFDGGVGEYLVTITYTASSDLKFSDKAEDYANVPAHVGFSRLMPFSSKPGKWVLIINDLGAMHYEYLTITPKDNAQGVQTMKCSIQLDSDDSVKKGFYLLFPPGVGFINLQGISFTKSP